MTLSVPLHHYTFQDYLDVEEMSAVKHEFLDGEIYAMAGGTPEHAALCTAIVLSFGTQLMAGPCRIYTSDLRLRVVATGLATYPDAAVICGLPERDPSSPTHVTNPSVLFEVLSPSTEAYDRGDKRKHYQQIESVREYVIVAQVQRRIEIWRRTDSGAWNHEILGAGDILSLASIGCQVAVDDLYITAGLDVG